MRNWEDCFRSFLLNFSRSTSILFNPHFKIRYGDSSSVPMHSCFLKCFLYLILFFFLFFTGRWYGPWMTLKRWRPLYIIYCSSSFFYYYLTSLYQKIATDTTTLSFVPKDQEIYDLFSIVESLLDHPSLQLYVYWVDVNIHELGSKQTTDPYKNSFSMLQDWYEPL